MYLVARKGLPLQEYGVVAASEAKAARLDGRACVLNAALIDAFEGFRKRFLADVHKSQDMGELDLERLAPDSTLEACAILVRGEEAERSERSAHQATAERAGGAPQRRAKGRIQRPRDKAHRRVHARASSFRATENPPFMLSRRNLPHPSSVLRSRVPPPPPSICSASFLPTPPPAAASLRRARFVKAAESSPQRTSATSG